MYLFWRVKEKVERCFFFLDIKKIYFSFFFFYGRFFIKVFIIVLDFLGYVINGWRRRIFISFFFYFWIFLNVVNNYIVCLFGFFGFL